MKKLPIIRATDSRGWTVVWNVTSNIRIVLTFNHKAGTVRGLHFQNLPHTETKCIMCIRGAIHDVALCLDPDDVSFGKVRSSMLDCNSSEMLILPKLSAHGYQTLTNQAMVLYVIEGKYDPECASGVCWFDPMVQVKWPMPISFISNQDMEWPRLNDSSKQSSPK